MKEKSLSELLRIQQGDFITITGGGGKTSLLFYLAEIWPDDRVILTTTTKMYYPEHYNGAVYCFKKEKGVYQKAARWFLYKENLGNGKVKGISDQEADWLKNEAKNHLILCEGDGSRQMPYKFYRENEPVIPQATTQIIHVIGSDVLGCLAAALPRCPEDKKQHHFDIKMTEEAMRYYTDEKINDFSCMKTLLINKAEGERWQSAEAMAEVSAKYFDQCLISSLKERTWQKWSLR